VQLSGEKKIPYTTEEIAFCVAFMSHCSGQQFIFLFETPVEFQFLSFIDWVPWANK